VIKDGAIMVALRYESGEGLSSGAAYWLLTGCTTGCRIRESVRAV
jgi:hypothetical protein